jgi:hypothetical protein
MSSSRDALATTDAPPAVETSHITQKPRIYIKGEKIRI